MDCKRTRPSSCDHWSLPSCHRYTIIRLFCGSVYFYVIRSCNKLRLQNGYCYVTKNQREIRSPWQGWQIWIRVHGFRFGIGIGQGQDEIRVDWDMVGQQNGKDLSRLEKKKLYFQTVSTTTGLSLVSNPWNDGSHLGVTSMWFNNENLEARSITSVG